jgi:hypothetical protein
MHEIKLNGRRTGLCLMSGRLRIVFNGLCSLVSVRNSISGRCKTTNPNNTIVTKIFALN